MRKLKVLMLAMLAIFVVGAVAAAVSNAELNTPELLLDGKASRNITTASGQTIIEGVSGEKLEVTSSIGKGEVSATSSLLGTLEMKFKGVNAVVGGIKFSCLTPGAAAGEFVLPFDYHLVFDTKPETGTNLGAGIILKLLKQVHMECPTAGILGLVKGSVLGLLKPTNKLVTSLELILTQTKGDNLEHTFWLLNASKVFEELKALPEPLELESTTTKKFTLWGLEMLQGTFKAEAGTEFLLMA